MMKPSTAAGTVKKHQSYDDDDECEDDATNTISDYKDSSVCN